jgi:hypothetical protein
MCRSKERTIKAKVELQVTGDRYEPTGTALVEISVREDSYFFSWKAEDAAETEIAEDSRSVTFTTLDNPRKPHDFLERYISTHIQKTQLKRKNRMKVVKWTWLER